MGLSGPLILIPSSEPALYKLLRIHIGKLTILCEPLVNWWRMPVGTAEDAKEVINRGIDILFFWSLRCPDGFPTIAASKNWQKRAVTEGAHLRPKMPSEAMNEAFKLGEFQDSFELANKALEATSGQFDWRKRKMCGNLRALPKAYLSTKRNLK